MKVIGLGNEHRHDDAAGLVAARRLRAHGIPAEEYDGDPAGLIERWQGVDDLLLIDAVVSGGAPGTVYCLDASVGPLDSVVFRSSTHALGLGDAVELARALEVLPGKVMVLGVEVRDVTPGIGLSPEVEGALAELVLRVVKKALSCRERA